MISKINLMKRTIRGNSAGSVGMRHTKPVAPNKGHWSSHRLVVNGRCTAGVAVSETRSVITTSSPASCFQLFHRDKLPLWPRPRCQCHSGCAGLRGCMLINHPCHRTGPVLSRCCIGTACITMPLALPGHSNLRPSRVSPCSSSRHRFNKPAGWCI